MRSAAWAAYTAAWAAYTATGAACTAAAEVKAAAAGSHLAFDCTASAVEAHTWLNPASVAAWRGRPSVQLDASEHHPGCQRCRS